MGTTEGKFNRDEDLLKRIGANVRKYRKLKALTIAQLSYKSGLGTTSIYEVEHGKVNSNVTTIQKIADALEITPGELFA